MYWVTTPNGYCKQKLLFKLVGLRIRNILYGMPWNGKLTWEILIGEAQCNMDWTYTHEEVMNKFNKRFKDEGN